jgi:hypothetical protein
MTDNQALHLRPGVRVLRGAEEELEVPVSPRLRATDPAYGDDTWNGGKPTPVSNSPTSWFELDCARMVGRGRLSLWELQNLASCATARGAALPALEDVRFMTAPSVSAAAAAGYVQALLGTILAEARV